MHVVQAPRIGCLRRDRSRTVVQVLVEPRVSTEHARIAAERVRRVHPRPARVLPRHDRKRLTAWASMASSRHEFRTNGLERGDKLIDPVTFDVWRLRKRDEDLDRVG